MVIAGLRREEVTASLFPVRPPKCSDHVAFIDNVERFHVGPLAPARLSVRIYTLIRSTQTGNTARLQPMKWPPIRTASANMNPI
jgi:hypothetical protein